MVVMEEQRGPVVRDPDLEDRLGSRSHAGPHPDAFEYIVRAIGYR
jgi:hypothetical protein